MTLELTSLSSLRSAVAQWRAAGETIALVPTMGALHRGHLTLVEHARQRAQRVIVSIFVNPTQFGPNEDFSRYPRPREKDLLMLSEEGVDAAWLPTVEEMYPQGFATSVQVKGISEVLEGAFRPGHFDGVATVVSKLLLQVMPDMALFGEKDFQQLCVIERVVDDLNIPVKIYGVPTVREADGLAMSSRNQYLSEGERQSATRLNQMLRHSAYVLKNEGRGVEETLKKGERFLLDAGFTKVDYIALCDENSLAPLMEYRSGARLLGAAWMGKTRLIDNISVE